MAALRCTGKLLKKLRITNPGEPPHPENRLGDWFANIVYTRQGHFLILVSDRSLLPVIITARGLDNLVPNFFDALADVLSALRVPGWIIDREIEAMQPLYFGKTNNRAVLGSMNDFINMMRWELENQDATPLQLALYLAGTPCGPLGRGFPNKVAVDLLKIPSGLRLIKGVAN
jgi:hypothetical protein